MNPPDIDIKSRLVPRLPNALHENPLAHRLLAARGVTDETELAASLSDLPRPSALPDIDIAVERLAQARELSQTIMIVGDYDCDGATSTSVAVLGLQWMGFDHVHYLLPNRFEHGYGLSPTIVELAVEMCNPDLIVTVDNGVASVEGVEWANHLGIDVLITDHHLSPPKLPNAIAVVNPTLPGSVFEGKCLAGVGVIFYTLLAFRSMLISKQDPYGKAPLADLLDLVAIGTIADVVPLDRVNRLLVEQGLRRIRHGSTRPGVLHLLELAGRKCDSVATSDIGFALAPRLNAAGRVEDMRTGVQCLLCDDGHRAAVLAKVLDDLNKKRRNIEQSMRDQALAQIEEITQNQPIDESTFSLCLYDEGWHAGVIGILAGRLKDHLNIPVIIFTKEDKQTLKGSARSIPGVHIKDLLQTIAASTPHMIDKFGGHAMAAGLTLASEHFSGFCEVFEKAVKQACNAVKRNREYLTDGVLQPSELNLANARLLTTLMPWGQQFEAPTFYGQFECIEARVVGNGHLKLNLGVQKNTDYLTIDAIAFNCADVPDQHEELRLVYSLEVNRWRDREMLQLRVHYLERLALR